MRLSFRIILSLVGVLALGVGAGDVELDLGVGARVDDRPDHSGSPAGEDQLLAEVVVDLVLVGKIAVTRAVPEMTPDG